jgi:hypothetical protein
MNCKFKNDLSAYCDGELNDKLRLDIENHLDSCSNCKEKLALFHSIKEISNPLCSIEAPYYLESKTISHLEKHAEHGYLSSLFDRILLNSFTSSPILPIIAAFAILTSLFLNFYLTPLKDKESIAHYKGLETKNDKESSSPVDPSNDIGLVIYMSSLSDDNILTENNSFGNIAMLFDSHKTDSRNIFDSITFYADNSKQTTVESRFDW